MANTVATVALSKTKGKVMANTVAHDALSKTKGKVMANTVAHEALGKTMAAESEPVAEGDNLDDSLV